MKYIEQTNEEMITNIKNGEYTTVFQGLQPLIKKEIGNKYWKYQNFDDILQSAYLGCWNAILKFNINDGRATLGTYCVVAAHRAVATYLTKNNNTIKGPNTSTYTGMTVEQQEGIAKAYNIDDRALFENNGGIEENDIEVYNNIFILKETVIELLNELNLTKPMIKNIPLFIEYYFPATEDEQLTFRDLGKKYNISYQAVNQKIKKMIEKINEDPKVKQKFYNLLTKNY